MDYSSFFSLYESSNYKQIISKHNTIGEYIEKVYLESTDDVKAEIGGLLNLYVKRHTNRKSSYKIDDLVYVEYWYNNIIVPGKIIERSGNKYTISFDVTGSDIRKAPNQDVLKEDIIDFYYPKEPKKEIPIDIRLSVSINMMNAYDQLLLLDNIQRVIKNEKYDLITDGDIEITYNGQTGFNVFLKVFNALNISTDELTNNVQNAPNSKYLLFLESDDINIPSLIRVFSRFRSFDELRGNLRSDITSIKMYYSINYDNSLTVEYGLILNKNKVLVVGYFDLNAKNFRNLSDKDNRYVSHMLSYLNKCSLEDIKLFTKISHKLSSFSPGYYSSKVKPFMEDGMLCFGYVGFGVWKDGMITTKSFDTFKNTLRDFFLKMGLEKKIVFNIRKNNFTLLVKVKANRQ